MSILNKRIFSNTMIPTGSFPFRESPDREKGVFIPFHPSILSDIFPGSGKIAINKNSVNILQVLHLIKLSIRRSPLLGEMPIGRGVRNMHPFGYRHFPFKGKELLMLHFTKYLLSDRHIKITCEPYFQYFNPLIKKIKD